MLGARQLQNVKQLNELNKIYKTTCLPFAQPTVLVEENHQDRLNANEFGGRVLQQCNVHSSTSQSQRIFEQAGLLSSRLLRRENSETDLLGLLTNLGAYKHA